MSGRCGQLHGQDEVTPYRQMAASNRNITLVHIPMRVCHNRKFRQLLADFGTFFQLEASSYALLVSAFERPVLV